MFMVLTVEKRKPVLVNLDQLLYARPAFGDAATGNTLLFFPGHGDYAETLLVLESFDFITSELAFLPKKAA